MNIIINGIEAAVKQGSSFEFVAENRAFTGSDSYTLSITLPLRGCLQNRAIFGHICRADLEKSPLVYDCQIHDSGFHHYGALTVVEVTDTEVKCQFLEGRSVQNYDNTFDSIYINELDLGEWPDSTSLPSDPAEAWQGLLYGQELVALPWVNNSSGIIQNEVSWDGKAYSYASHVSRLSYQPYLIVLTRRICQAVGYDADLTPWEQREDLSLLLVCNTLPAAWEVPQLARALPHWSVTEFLEKLELLLDGAFTIDHKAKTVSFNFYAQQLEEIEPVLLENVVESYSAEIAEQEQCEYLGNATLRYKECSHSMWNYYCCPWFVKAQQANTISYDTLTELVEDNIQFAECTSYPRGSRVNKVLYAADVGTHFVVRCVRTEQVTDGPRGYKGYKRICELQPVNVFGDRVADGQSENTVELELVPAWVDSTEESKGKCLFLDIAAFDEEVADTTLDTDPGRVYQPIAAQLLAGGEPSGERAQYFDRIYLAFWDGAVPEAGKLPYPYIDWVTMGEGWNPIIAHVSMRLGATSARAERPRIDSRHKYEFKFLAKEIPDPRAVFNILGKRYLCEKITATFTEDGMSRLLKGTFYQVKD